MGTYPNTIEDLSDFDETGLADLHAMVWNAAAGKWVPGAAPVQNIPPTGVTYQNFDRQLASIANTVSLLTGQPRLTAIWLPANFVVSNISMMSGGTAMTLSGTGPHFWMALYDSNRNVLRQSTDAPTATWSTNSLKTVSLSAPFTTTYTGLHYAGLMVQKGSTGTLPTMIGANALLTNLVALAPILNGNSSTSNEGATATSPAGALSATAGVIWAGVA